MSNPVADSKIVGATVDLDRLMALLGPSIYGTDLFNVVVKELFQNAFDAVKSAAGARQIREEDGQISFFFDPDERTITVSDNGIGMSPEIVETAFIRAFGSHKGNLKQEERSGGFGMAKFAFLYGSKELELVTTQNGVQTILRTSGSELLQGKGRMQTIAVPGALNGTTVRVRLPEKAGDNSDRLVNFPKRREEVRALNKPFSGKQTMAAQFTSEDYYTYDLSSYTKGYNVSKVITVKFKWADIDVYMGDKDIPFNIDSSDAHCVLSSGFFQFGKRIPLSSDEKSSWERIPVRIWLDVKSRVPAEHPLYPFNRQRENWSPAAEVEKDVKVLNAILRQIYNERLTTQNDKNFSTINKMSPDLGPEHDLRWEKVQFPVMPHQTIITGPKQCISKCGDDIYQGSRKIELPSSEQKTDSVDRQNFLSFKRTILLDTGRPYIHIPLNRDPTLVASNPNILPIRKLRHILLFFGEEVLRFQRALGTVEGFEAFKQGQRIGGITLQKGLNGIYIHSPLIGFLVNPLSFSADIPSAVAWDIWHTMLHEAAHHKYRQHDEQFAYGLGDLHALIEQANPGFLLDSFSRLNSFLEKNWLEFRLLRKAYNEPAIMNTDLTVQGYKFLLQKNTPDASTPIIDDLDSRNSTTCPLPSPAYPKLVP